MKRQRERTEAQCCYLGALWVVMHLIASIRSGIYSMYRSYDSWTYILIAAYVIVLVLFNIWLLETLLYTAMGSKGAIYAAFGMLLLSAAEFLYNHYLIRRAEKGAFDESLEL